MCFFSVGVQLSKSTGKFIVVRVYVLILGYLEIEQETTINE
jgi:hypothetical protein